METLIIPAFIAGVLTFLAPCTLPLVPGYLGFISGVPQRDLERRSFRGALIRNGIFFVVGFTIVFVAFGSLAGLLGGALTPYQEWLTRIGGVLIIVFGLFMLGILDIPLLKRTRQIKLPGWLTLGTPTASLIVGGTFALGWTPCIGPLLGSILLLASTKTTAFSGALLLLVFSIGLSIPFIAVALIFSRAATLIEQSQPYLRAIAVCGGIFLVVLGVLLLLDQFELTIRYGFMIMRALGLTSFESLLLEYL